MSQSEELLRLVRRNKLIGIWAAEKLGLVADSAKAYSDDLAMGTLDRKRDADHLLPCDLIGPFSARVARRCRIGRDGKEGVHLDGSSVLGFPGLR